MFATTLYAHQAAAAKKIAPLKVGALYMEMGTGKTRTILEVVYPKLRAGKCSRVVWLTPVTFIRELKLEILKHVPEASVVSVDEKTTEANIPTGEILLVGSESISGSVRVRAAFARACEGAAVVVDESDLFRNYTTKRTVALRKAAPAAKYRYVMSGSPMGKGIEDLYPSIEFLSHLILGYRDFNDFARHHLEWTDDVPRRIAKRHNTGVITAKLAPYVFQVRKEECLDLPPKVYQQAAFGMTHAQLEEYAAIKQRMLNELYAECNESAIYKMFTLLQQCSSGYYRPISWEGGEPPSSSTTWWDDLTPKYAEGDLTRFFEKLTENPRIRSLMRVVGEVAADRKVIVWVKYHMEAEDVRAALVAEYGEELVCELTGRLSQSERDEELHWFRTGGRFLIATTGTGGRMLTLTEATYAVYYSNSFKYIDRIQSEDRIHRIGQAQRCTYVDIASLFGIDQIILKCLAKRESAYQDFRQAVNEVKELKGKDADKAKDRLKKLFDGMDKVVA